MGEGDREVEGDRKVRSEGRSEGGREGGKKK